MSQLSQIKKKDTEIKLSVKDTDFLLKLIMRSAFEGVEIESAYNVIKKLSELHRLHLEG